MMKGMKKWHEDRYRSMYPSSPVYCHEDDYQYGNKDSWFNSENVLKIIILVIELLSIGAILLGIVDRNFLHFFSEKVDSTITFAGVLLSAIGTCLGLIIS